MNQAGYALPQDLEPDLRQALDYWEKLKRGYGSMPYWDDIHLSELGHLQDCLFLLDRFEQHDRFRFRMAGAALTARYGDELIGYYLDEIPMTGPFDRLAEQVSATVNERAPTYCRHETSDRSKPGEARLLLPFWGAGRIDMILGAVAEAG
jgi:hypothetical protein